MVENDGPDSTYTVDIFLNISVGVLFFFVGNFVTALYSNLVQCPDDSNVAMVTVQLLIAK